MKRRLESEIALARQLFTLVQQDAHIGFEPSCQYFYLPLDLVEKVVKGAALGRTGQPEEVARAIVWLLSDEASYVTGTILDVTGGR